MNFHTLTVAETRREIDTALSVMFDVPDELQSEFAWKAGQHLALRFTINGEEVRRSYSISSSPDTGERLRITVKRVKDGLVSNYINDQMQAGKTVDVMPPFGGFHLKPGETDRRSHYFFAAGSGITPLFAMLNSVLAAEPYSDVYLLYGNKNADSIIFRDALEQLQQDYQGRIAVCHVLSAPSMWSVLTPSTFTPWQKGNINAELIQQFINECPPYAQDAQYYICSPGSMNHDVKAALMGIDIPAERIHMESYGSTVEQDTSISGIAASAVVILEGQAHSIQIKAGQTLLEAARVAGLNAPFSCESGVCGACRAQLKQGAVHMRASMALEADKIANGAILSCQSVPTETEIAFIYE